MVEAMREIELLAKYIYHALKTLGQKPVHLVIYKTIFQGDFREFKRIFDCTQFSVLIENVTVSSHPLILPLDT